MRRNRVFSNLIESLLNATTTSCDICQVSFGGFRCSCCARDGSFDRVRGLNLASCSSTVDRRVRDQEALSVPPWACRRPPKRTSFAGSRFSGATGFCQTLITLTRGHAVICFWQILITASPSAKRKLCAERDRHQLLNDVRGADSTNPRCSICGGLSLRRMVRDCNRQSSPPTPHNEVSMVVSLSLSTSSPQHWNVPLTRYRNGLGFKSSCRSKLSSSSNPRSDGFPTLTFDVEEQACIECPQLFRLQ